MFGRKKRTNYEGRTVVLVGHCFPDRFMIKSAIKRAVPGSSLETVNEEKGLEPYLNGSAVLLVNRELDGTFVTDSGIELIEQVMKGDDPPVTILISNYEDAQTHAEAAGANPGFGKSDLYEARTVEILRTAAGE